MSEQASDKPVTIGGTTYTLREEQWRPGVFSFHLPTEEFAGAPALAFDTFVSDVIAAFRLEEEFGDEVEAALVKAEQALEGVSVSLATLPVRITDLVWDEPGGVVTVSFGFSLASQSARLTVGGATVSAIGITIR